MLLVKLRFHNLRSRCVAMAVVKMIWAGYSLGQCSVMKARRHKYLGMSSTGPVLDIAE
jgi:hypothetical protein